MQVDDINYKCGCADANCDGVGKAPGEEHLRRWVVYEMTDSAPKATGGKAKKVTKEEKKKKKKKKKEERKKKEAEEAEKKVAKKEAKKKKKKRRRKKRRKEGQGRVVKLLVIARKRVISHKIFL